MKTIDPIASRSPVAERVRWVLTRAAFAVLIFLLAAGGLALSRNGASISPLWLANGVLAVVLLHSTRRTVLGWIVAALLGFISANLAGHFQYVGAVVLALINCAEAAGGTWLVLRWQKTVP
ncbi:hypothetical protein DBR17_14165, partial [Sphingomonas sp. HMWF008]